MHLIAPFVLALLPLAYAQTPFPVAFKQVNSVQGSSIASLASAYATSVESQPAFTSFVGYMATATGLTPDEDTAFKSALDNPLLLGNAFFTATATPAWYTQIPSDLQSYVSSIANSEASIVSKVASDAGRLGARTSVVGALLATALLGVIML